ncbi:MAG: P1 family peptidase [Pyrinomonadaceae bacterium]|jgi:D-aminopeptidase
MNDLTRSLRIVLTALLFALTVFSQSVERPRVRDLGLSIGIFPNGEFNAITDVSGVFVGHTTIIRGDNIRTGVTAVLPHSGNLFRQKVPAAIFVGNGFGKLAGSTQVNELGEIETPVLLTSTMSVPKVADFLIDYMLSLPGNDDIRSVNPLVAETNDGFLNDIRLRAISRDDVFNAIRSAKSGVVEEGSVGAGTGTIAFGWKGGIGTSSRRLPADLGGFTVGVLVQTNFGGQLYVDGVPVGKELALKSSNRSSFSRQNPQSGQTPKFTPGDGSIIIVIATDAPLDHRLLYRLAARSMAGLARTGSSMSNGSGDYAIAFSTANRIFASENIRKISVIGNDAISPLFQAVIECTEEAILNSIFRATTISGNGRTIEAVPIDQIREILRKYGRLK